MIVLYEGVLFLATKPISVYFFYALTGVGLLFTWMDKSTKLYMLPDDPTRFGNPVFDIIVPDFFKHHFNANTLPVFLFDTSPIAAIHIWPVLFIAGMVFLARWYSKLYPLAVEIPVIKQKQAPKKFKKK